METLLLTLTLASLILTIIVALGSLLAIYFIVRANAEGLKRLVNALVAQSTEELLILNQEDERPRSKPQPQPKDDNRFVEPDQMTDEDIQKYIEAREG